MRCVSSLDGGRVAWSSSFLRGIITSGWNKVIDSVKDSSPFRITLYIVKFHHLDFFPWLICSQIDQNYLGTWYVLCFFWGTYSAKLEQSMFVRSPGYTHPACEKVSLFSRQFSVPVQSGWKPGYWRSQKCWKSQATGCLQKKSKTLVRCRHIQQGFHGNCTQVILFEPSKNIWTRISELLNWTKKF